MRMRRLTREVRFHHTALLQASTLVVTKESLYCAIRISQLKMAFLVEESITPAARSRLCVPVVRLGALHRQHQ